jgi:hypothetical protein
MSTQIQRTYRITIDMVTTSDAQPHATVSDAHAARSHLAVMERLQAHPEVLDPLLRSLVIGRLDEAKKLLDAEYGSRLPEHKLLQPIIAELEPEAQAYLTEELEDGCQVYYFDGFETNLKRYQMTLLEEESS